MTRKTLPGEVLFALVLRNSVHFYNLGEIESLVNLYIMDSMAGFARQKFMPGCGAAKMRSAGMNGKKKRNQ
jgi:hypothetical protein